MAWINPTPYNLFVTDDPDSWKTAPKWSTGLPIAHHPGAFGVKRKHHTHEGIDFYLPQATPIVTVEAGEVVDVRIFTGEALGHSWWNTTYAVWVKGESGIVVYGEIAPHVKKGQKLVAGELVGVVIKVLKVDKGRPMSMLHLELRDNDDVSDIEWLGDEKPLNLLDPTPYLLEGLK